MSALKWFFLGCCVSAAVAWLLPHEAAIPRPVVVAGSAQPGAPTLPDFASLLERVGPSVVNVTTRSTVRTEPEVGAHHFQIFRGLLGELAPKRTVSGLGSGFVLDDGYILTNAHVIDGVDEVYVRQAGSKRELKASIVGVDPTTDIALLRVGAAKLPAAPLGSSRELRAGDWVAAIGSPFGFESTITAGIISAKERSLPNGSQRFLQSDVAINPGSSGGPLVNLNGEVVGINSKIYTRTGGYMGVSFAIPIETALKVSSELRRRGHVARGFLGIEAQPLSETLAASFHLSAPRGALVTAVHGGSPASRAGIRPGDIVLAFGEQAIEEPGELLRAVADTAPGTRKALQLWRRRATIHADVLIVADPDQSATRHAPRRIEQAEHRLDLTEIAPQSAGADQPRGLLVRAAGGAAGPDALQPGDVIVAVEGTPVSTRGEFDRLLRNSALPVALLVMRAGKSQYVALETGPL